MRGYANTIYPQLVDEIITKGEKVNTRNGYSIELHPSFNEFHNIRQRYISTKGRMINLPFALAETVWILSGDNSVERVGFYNSRIADIASDNGVDFNAAYGHRIRHEFGIDQLKDVLLKLKDKNTRQALFIYSSPKGDASYVETKDRACNISSMFLIRNGVLNLTQTIRSNDVILGLPYNLVQFTTLQEVIAEVIGVYPGTFYHLANSLHLYDHDFCLLYTSPSPRDS